MLKSVWRWHHGHHVLILPFFPLRKPNHATTQKHRILKSLTGSLNVLRHMLCLVRKFLRHSLVSKALRHGAQCPVTGGDLGMWKSLAMLLSRSSVFSSSHYITVRPQSSGEKPCRMSARRGLESYKRAVCSYKGSCQRRTWARIPVWRWTNVQMYWASSASLWWSAHIILNCLKGMQNELTGSVRSINHIYLAKLSKLFSELAMCEAHLMLAVKTLAS